MALWLWPSNPTALLNLADSKLNADAATKMVEPVLSSSSAQASHEGYYQKGVQEIEAAGTPQAQQTPSTEGALPQTNSTDSNDTLTDTDYREIRAWAEQALSYAPLNARALRILGQLAERMSDEERTAALMQAAVKRSLHESFAVFWMMRQSYREQHYASAIRYADILLRTRPELAKYVMPMLGRIAENSNASGGLKQLLAGNPPWRLDFFRYLPLNITDARTPLEILLSLRDTPSPSTDAEQRSYIDFLVQHGLYELAYYSWLQFLPPEQLSKTGRLFNGSFETVPSGIPFDWVFSQGAGVSVKLAQRPDQEGKRALLLQFGPGRVAFGDVTQLVLLPPGTYHFQGKYKADLVSQRGLQWSVKCAGSKDPVAVSSTMNGADPSWRDIEFSFTVPDSNCPAQYVGLTLDARSASEQFVSGSVWYDDLNIIREPDNAAQNADEPSLAQP